MHTHMHTAISLPINDFINDFSLLCGCLPKINAGGFNAFMSHKIGKEGNIITAIQKAFCKPVSEGMRIYNSGIDIVFISKLLQLTRYASGSDSLSVFV